MSITFYDGFDLADPNDDSIRVHIVPDWDYLKQRVLSQAQVAKLFGVPPHLLGGNYSTAANPPLKFDSVRTLDGKLHVRADVSFSSFRRNP